MRPVQASDAKTHLPLLLDEVERGETIPTTRHGKPIARLVPEADRRQAEISRVITDLRAMRRDKDNKLSVAEILASRHEDHSY